MFADADSGMGDFSTEADGDVSVGGVAAPQYRKQGFSIYTMMLLLSFLFLTTAAIMFYINSGNY